MEFLKNKRIIFNLYVNLCIGVFITFSSYIHLPIGSFKDFVIYTGHFILLQITLYGFTYFLTLNKWLFKIVFSVLFMVLSCISFWVYTLDISVSVDLIELSLASKPDIFFDLLSLPFIVFFLMVLVVLYTILRTFNKINWDIKDRMPGLVFSSLAVVFFFFMERRKLGVFKRRMPYIVLSETKEYLKRKPINISEINTRLSAKNKMNIVFVLGESVRGKNMHLNGYQRETNPLLSSRENIFSFKNMYTPHTYTARSIPQILTNKSINDSLHKNIYSIYSVLNKANYNTVWIGNQSPEISYKGFIIENKEIDLIDVEHSVLSYHKKLDEELLDSFKDKFKGGETCFYTLHMIGSHWWYEGRYPDKFKTFNPVVKSKFIPSNTKEEMINSYDNTILYLDYFLNDLISFIEKRDDETVLIYLSDHGETLGEDGKWLHAQNNEASKNPAGLIWCSNKFKKKHLNKIENLNTKLEKEITTDFLFHTVLDLIDVQSFEYDVNKSVFSEN